MDSITIENLIAQGRQGNELALAELFEHFQPRLQRMVELRLDARLKGRIDAADVLQETFLDVVKGIDDYAQHEDFPFFLWLRLMTGRRLMNVHRAHLAAQKRSAARERQRGNIPGATSMSLADLFARSTTSVSKKVERAELREKIEQSIEAMDPLDREILTLRHFEELSNSEVARELDLSKSAASNRYIRALTRLREIM